MTPLRLLRKYSYYLVSIFRLLLGFENPVQLVKIFLHLDKPGLKTVRLRRSGLVFKVRGPMDVWSIKETFLDRFYEVCGFELQPNWNVIDVGAGIGDYTLYAATAKPGIRVVSLEPYSESYALMQENLQVNAVTNAQPFDHAVAAASGELVLDIAGGEPLQIQSRPRTVRSDATSVPVRALSLEDLFHLSNLKTCDLLKLDCEGAEYSILFGTPQHVLNLVDRIVLEYHDHVVEHNHHDLARFLMEQGFHVETFSNPVHSDLGYLRAIRTK